MTLAAPHPASSPNLSQTSWLKSARFFTSLPSVPHPGTPGGEEERPVPTMVVRPPPFTPSQPLPGPAHSCSQAPVFVLPSFPNKAPRGVACPRPRVCSLCALLMVALHQNLFFWNAISAAEIKARKMCSLLPAFHRHLFPGMNVYKLV